MPNIKGEKPTSEVTPLALLPRFAASPSPKESPSSSSSTIVLLLGTIVLLWLICLGIGRPNSPPPIPGEEGIPYPSRGGGPRIDPASEGCLMRGGRCWPGYPGPLRMDMPLLPRGISPPTNRGNLLSSSWNTSAARSLKRGGPKDDNR